MRSPSWTRSLLPVGGRSGTLRHRFLNTSCAGRVHAKTGTLTGVSALSGYLDHPDSASFGRVVFSIVANGGAAYGGELRPFEDAIVEQTALARAC